MTVKHSLIALLLGASLSLASPVMANIQDDFDAGVSAYRTQNYKQAFYFFEKLAKEGYAKAQYNLGVMYRDGKGVDQDKEQAIYWYFLAARQGYLNAQVQLAKLYYENMDFKQSKYWLEQAKKQGYTPKPDDFGVGHDMSND